VLFLTVAAGSKTRVLTYPRVLRSSGLAPLDVAEYLEFLVGAATVVNPSSVPEDLLKDLADAPVLGTALAGKADVLCTRDAHFFSAAVQKFTAAHAIQVLTDLELLRRFA